MAEASRSQKSVKNAIFSLGSNMITQLPHFIVRSVFIKVLGASYNGIDGLFTNILTMLSLADLGIGVAMAHTYYKPLAEKDEEKISTLTALYSKIYLVIGLVVFLAGMMLMPFLPGLIKDIEKVRALGLNLRFVYFWYLLNSAVSYMFAAYKQTLLVADQKQYVVKNIQMFFAVITSVLQIGCLIIFRDKSFTYYLYLLCNIIFQILKNLYIAYKTDKMYPFIKIRKKAVSLKEDIKKLVKDVYSLMLYRVCIVILNGTDNIIIARFVNDGIRNIGSYNNYTFLIGSVNTLLVQIFNSIMASVGNLIAEIGDGKLVNGDDKAYNTYKAINFANFWLFGMCSVVLWVMLEPFVNFWLRSTDVIFLTDAVIFVLIANFYVNGVQLSTTAFRNAYGLFQQGKYRPVVMALLNIGLSIWLVRDLGLLGVFLGTLISSVTTMVWFDPYVVHKYGFKKSVLPFVGRYIFRVLLLIVIGIATEWLVNLMPSNHLPWLFLRGILAVIIVNVLLYAVYCRSKELEFVKIRVKNVLKKFKKI